MTKGVTAHLCESSASVPSFPLLPSVPNLFACFCGRGAWLLAWRFDRPSVWPDKSRCCHQRVSNSSVPSFPLLPSVQISSLASVDEALGFWRGDSIDRASGLTKAIAATSANPIPQSPSFPLLPSVQISSLASVGEALGFWRGDSINRASGLTKAVAATSAYPIPQSLRFLCYLLFKSLRLLLWMRRLAFGVATEPPVTIALFPSNCRFMMKRLVPLFRVYYDTKRSVLAGPCEQGAV
jgi:hypothetical protein